MIHNFGERRVAQFIKAFGASMDPRFWIGMVREEVKELEEALANEPAANILKEACDVLYVGFGLILTGNEDYFDDIMPDREMREVEALGDKCVSLLSEVKARLDITDATLMDAFNRVHESNMSKLDDNGRPIRREDGKILKGPNYKAPDLSDLVAA